MHKRHEKSGVCQNVPEWAKMLLGEHLGQMRSRQSFLAKHIILLFTENWMRSTKKRTWYLTSNIVKDSKIFLGCFAASCNGFLDADAWHQEMGRAGYKKILGWKCQVKSSHYNIAHFAHSAVEQASKQKSTIVYNNVGRFSKTVTADMLQKAPMVWDRAGGLWSGQKWVRSYVWLTCVEITKLLMGVHTLPICKTWSSLQKKMGPEFQWSGIRSLLMVIV